MVLVVSPTSKFRFQHPCPTLLFFTNDGHQNEDFKFEGVVVAEAQRILKSRLLYLISELITS